MLMRSSSEPQQAITRGLDDAAAVAGDSWIDHLQTDRFQRRQRAAVITENLIRAGRYELR
jgi:hypothetical protein